MFTIHLHNLQFFSFHGLYQEERVLGGRYEVNADISFKTGEKIALLEQTIDYVKIYHIIKQQMNMPTALLETVAEDLALRMYESDTRITSVNISLKKINPPIANFQGSVAVSYKKDF
jgi:dihydroneopterin aldolase